MFKENLERHRGRRQNKTYPCQDLVCTVIQNQVSRVTCRWHDIVVVWQFLVCYWQLGYSGAEDDNDIMFDTWRVLLLPRVEHILARLSAVNYSVGSLRYATHVIDKDADSAWYAKNGPSVIVARGDITKRLPYADKFFDYVWTSHVAEHMPDPQHFCGEISRITKVGGVFCVPAQDEKWRVLNFL